MGRKREKGFTLLELTAAMLVTSLIVLAVASSIAAIADGWARGERRSSDREAVRIMARRLGREFAALNRGPFGTGTCFEGDREGFAFDTASDDGPRHLKLALIEGRIVLAQTTLRHPSDCAQVSIPLIEPIDSLTLGYYDPVKRQWRDEWPTDEHDRPPSLVRIVYCIGPKGHQRRSPVLVLPIQAGRILDAREVDPIDY
jgi:hypothetical protein